MIVNKQNQDIRHSNDSLENTRAVSEGEALGESNSFGSYEVDILSQFKANLNQLDELQARFKYVLHEVSGLLTKK